jgi:hypothetical protein
MVTPLALASTRDPSGICSQARSSSYGSEAIATASDVCRTCSGSPNVTAAICVPSTASDQRFTTAGQGQGVTVYVVDGLFDASNAEFGGRASVGLASGVACGLEDGTNHGLFVAGLVAGRRTGVAKQAKIVSVGSSYGCEGGNGGATEAQVTARIARALNWVAQNARRPAVVNLSLNVNAPAPTVTTAVKRLVDVSRLSPQRAMTVKTPASTRLPGCPRSSRWPGRRKPTRTPG